MHNAIPSSTGYKNADILRLLGLSLAQHCAWRRPEPPDADSARATSMSGMKPNMSLTRAPGPVPVTVVMRTTDEGDGQEDASDNPAPDNRIRPSCRRDRFVAGSIRGTFHPDLYVDGQDCITYNGERIGRSRFERLGNSSMAKWHRSIRVVHEDGRLEPLGEWLSRHSLPVLKGKQRVSRKRVVKPGGAAAAAAAAAASFPLAVAAAKASGGLTPAAAAVVMAMAAAAPTPHPPSPGRDGSATAVQVEGPAGEGSSFAVQSAAAAATGRVSCEVEGQGTGFLPPQQQQHALSAATTAATAGVRAEAGQVFGPGAVATAQVSQVLAAAVVAGMASVPATKTMTASAAGPAVIAPATSEATTRSPSQVSASAGPRADLMTHGSMELPAADPDLSDYSSVPSATTAVSSWSDAQRAASPASCQGTSASPPQQDGCGSGSGDVGQGPANSAPYDIRMGTAQSPHSTQPAQQQQQQQAEARDALEAFCDMWEGGGGAYASCVGSSDGGGGNLNDVPTTTAATTTTAITAAADQVTAAITPNDGSLTANACTPAAAATTTGAASNRDDPMLTSCDDLADWWLAEFAAGSNGGASDDAITPTAAATAVTAAAATAAAAAAPADAASGSSPRHFGTPFAAPPEAWCGWERGPAFEPSSGAPCGGLGDTGTVAAGRRSGGGGDGRGGWEGAAQGQVRGVEPVLRSFGSSSAQRMQHQSVMQVDMTSPPMLMSSAPTPPPQTSLHTLQEQWQQPGCGGEDSGAACRQHALFSPQAMDPWVTMGQQPSPVGLSPSAPYLSVSVDTLTASSSCNRSVASAPQPPPVLSARRSLTSHLGHTAMASDPMCAVPAVHRTYCRTAARYPPPPAYFHPYYPAPLYPMYDIPPPRHPYTQRYPPLRYPLARTRAVPMPGPNALPFIAPPPGVPAPVALPEPPLHHLARPHSLRWARHGALGQCGYWAEAGAHVPGLVMGGGVSGGAAAADGDAGAVAHHAAAVADRAVAAAQANAATAAALAGGLRWEPAEDLAALQEGRGNSSSSGAPALTRGTSTRLGPHPGEQPQPPLELSARQQALSPFQLYGPSGCRPVAPWAHGTLPKAALQPGPPPPPQQQGGGYPYLRCSGGGSPVQVRSMRYEAWQRLHVAQPLPADVTEPVVGMPGLAVANDSWAGMGDLRAVGMEAEAAEMGLLALGIGEACLG